MQAAHSFTELMAFATQEEAKARALYEDLAGKIVDKGARTMLLEMADMEKSHELKLKAFGPSKAATGKGGPSQDLKIAEYTVAKPLSSTSGVQEVILFAIQAEAKAHQLYSDMAASVAEAAHKSFFEALAAEELSHKNALERAYDENIFREN